MIPMSTITPENAARADKRQAFVKAAREGFLTNGYAATTMSMIAAKVGGSKTTLWSYFPSKEHLFAAVLDDMAELYCEALTVELDPAAPIEQELRRFAHVLLRTIFSEPIVALQRMVIAEADRFPELGQMVFDRGPRLGKARFAAFVGRAMELGKLRPGDAALVAGQFSALCKAEFYHEAMFGIRLPDATMVELTVDGAIETFMRAWGAARP
jgi:TetR/AcrR family transcriptional regulator, mexJK operon transcriptional repressor